MENKLILDGMKYVIISEQENEEFENLKHKELLRSAVRDIKNENRQGMSLAEFQKKLIGDF